MARGIFEFKVRVRDLRDDRVLVQVFDVGTNNISTLTRPDGDPHPNPFLPTGTEITFWSVVPIHDIAVSTPFGTEYIHAAFAGTLHEIAVDRSPGPKIVMLPLNAETKEGEESTELPVHCGKFPFSLPAGARRIELHIHQEGVRRMRKICQRKKRDGAGESDTTEPEKSPPRSIST